MSTWNKITDMLRKQGVPQEHMPDAVENELQRHGLAPTPDQARALRETRKQIELQRGLAADSAAIQQMQGLNAQRAQHVMGGRQASGLNSRLGQNPFSEMFEASLNKKAEPKYAVVGVGKIRGYESFKNALAGAVCASKALTDVVDEILENIHIGQYPQEEGVKIQIILLGDKGPFTMCNEVFEGSKQKAWAAAAKKLEGMVAGLVMLYGE